MDIAMLIKAFVVGGIICAIGQVLIDYTKLTPARILVSFVVIGVILGGIGLYQPLIDFAGAGATVPLTGFGATLAKGVREAVAADGFFGALTGGLTASAGGITVELSEDKQERLNAKNVAEQDVTLGVRPDHIMLCADGIKGHVEVSELMGSSVHLHISTVDSKDVIVIVPTNGAAANFPMGSEVNLIFGGNVAHVFSKEDGHNLEW